MAEVQVKAREITVEKAVTIPLSPPRSPSGRRQSRIFLMDPVTRAQLEVSYESFHTDLTKEMMSINSDRTDRTATSTTTPEDAEDLFEILENASFDLNEQLNAAPRNDSLVRMSEERRTKILSGSTPDLNVYLEQQQDEVVKSHRKERERGVQPTDSFDFSEVWWEDTQSQAELPVTMMKIKRPSAVTNKKREPFGLTPNRSNSPLRSTLPLSPKDSHSSSLFQLNCRKSGTSCGGQIQDTSGEAEASEPQAIPAPPFYEEFQRSPEPETTKSNKHQMLPATPGSTKRKKKCIKVRAKDLGIAMDTTSGLDSPSGNGDGGGGSSKQVDMHKVQDAFRKWFSSTKDGSGDPNNHNKKRSKSRGRTPSKRRDESAAGSSAGDRERSKSRHRSRSRTSTNTNSDEAAAAARKERKRRSLSRPRRRSMGSASEVSGAFSTSSPPTPDSGAAYPNRHSFSTLERTAGFVSPSRTGSNSKGLTGGMDVEDDPAHRRRCSSLSPKKKKDGVSEVMFRDDAAPRSPITKSPCRIRRPTTATTTENSSSLPLRQPSRTSSSSNSGWAQRTTNTDKECSSPRSPRRSVVRTISSTARDIGITPEQLQQLYAAGFTITEKDT